MEKENNECFSTQALTCNINVDEKNVKKCKKRSSIYDDYGKFVNGTFICKYCSQVYKANSSTTNIKKHLEKLHAKEFSEKKRFKRMTLDEIAKSRRTTLKAAISNFSFTTFDKPEVQKILKENYAFSSISIKKEALIALKEVQNALKKLFGCTWIATVDIWSFNELNISAITGTTIDDCGNIVERLITLFELNEIDVSTYKNLFSKKFKKIDIKMPYTIMANCILSNIDLYKLKDLELIGCTKHKINNIINKLCLDFPVLISKLNKLKNVLSNSHSIRKKLYNSVPNCKKLRFLVESKPIYIAYFLKSLLPFLNGLKNCGIKFSEEEKTAIRNLNVIMNICLHFVEVISSIDITKFILIFIDVIYQLEIYLYEGKYDIGIFSSDDLNLEFIDTNSDESDEDYELDEDHFNISTETDKNLNIENSLKLLITSFRELLNELLKRKIVLKALCLNPETLDNNKIMRKEVWDEALEILKNEYNKEVKDEEKSDNTNKRFPKFYCFLQRLQSMDQKLFFGSCSYKEKELIRRYFIPLSSNKCKSLFSFIKMRFNSHCKSTSFKLLESEIVLMSNPDLY